jgi:hypothetical protein
MRQKNRGIMNNYYLIKEDGQYYLAKSNYLQIPKNCFYYNEREDKILLAAENMESNSNIFYIIGSTLTSISSNVIYELLDKEQIKNLDITKRLSVVSIKEEVVCTSSMCRGNCGRCDSIEIMPTSENGFIEIIQVLDKTWEEEILENLIESFEGDTNK